VGLNQEIPQNMSMSSHCLNSSIELHVVTGQGFIDAKTTILTSATKDQKVKLARRDSR